MKRLELPAGSGKVADYDAREQEIMRKLVRRREETGDPKMLNEMLVLHALKAEFGVNLVDSEIEL